MRLIGTFSVEKEAYGFHHFLLKQGIQNTYEPFVEGVPKQTHYRMWIYSEEDLDKALQCMQEFQQNPQDAKFQDVAVASPISEKNFGNPEAEGPPPISITQLKIRRISFLLTHLIIVLCSFLFIWNTVEKAQMEKERGELTAELSFSTLQQELLFDFPETYERVNQFLLQTPLGDYKDLKELPKEAQRQLEKIEELPFWQGFYAFFLSVKKEGWDKASKVPMFEKIQKGQLWRLFTPSLMHRDLLHILFNMAWVWILLKQIEARLSKFKICMLILFIALVSNVAQYLVSGPNFLGFSGVVVGLAGFIWMRQRLAPWEGYPLQKATFLFLVVFVLAMFALEVVLFTLKVFSVVQITPIIANTAHIVGGFCGMALGRLSFFSRRPL